MLAILDTLTLPGIPERANEDRFGFTAETAFVIDGATGLGDPVFSGPGGSDAAWIADFAALGFSRMLSAGKGFPDAVRTINASIAQMVDRAEAKIPDWAIPIAAFQGISWRNGILETCGLGDCSLFIVDRDGIARHATGLPGAGERERNETRALAEHGGERTSRHLYERPDVKQRLRDARARFNKPGQPVWTLSAAPDAADHVSTVRLDLSLPAIGVVATDGFAALVDTYKHFDPAGLVAAARNDGLALLGDLLRQTEEVGDPGCTIWPRYKVSDDATAVLFEIRD